MPHALPICRGPAPGPLPGQAGSIPATWKPHSLPRGRVCNGACEQSLARQEESVVGCLEEGASWGQWIPPAAPAPSLLTQI